mmetsp:Transcript_50296/g.83742  ORF Transcript_50296/g.83742 Transcript_50296/m.83742 type:complete len:274 (+) Transcript_50296:72-893(+)
MSLLSSNDKKSGSHAVGGVQNHEPTTKKAKHEYNTIVLQPPLRKALEQIVKECMKNFDGSHDFFHVDRVRNLSLQIAIKEGIKDLELVELTALLHDINDHKYVEKHHHQQNNQKVAALLQKHEINAEKQKKMQLIIDNMSFSKEIKLKNDDNPEVYTKYLQLFASMPEMGCVQDADRLDAIGCIGIARAFCFGGAQKNRPLFNFASDNKQNFNVKQWTEHNECKDTTIGHFYEKLLLLKDMMKTETGKHMAQAKHEKMTFFLDSFLKEWQGDF